MKKLIKVTKEHIKDGIKESTLCPIALALKGYLVKPFINDSIKDIAHINKKYNYPKSVRSFFLKFDSHIPVKPFNFYLKVK